MADTSLLPRALPKDRARGWSIRVRTLLRFSGRTALLGTALMLFSGCALSVLIRLFWKDSLPALAPAFYATPLALVWCGLACSSGMFLCLRKSAWAMTAALGAVACWSHWQHESLRAAEPLSSESSIEVVFWNIARLKFGWEPVAREIQQKSAPLMGFVEAGADDPTARERWRRDFPGHHPVFFGNGMVLLFQGKVLETEHGALGRGSYYGRAILEWRGQRVSAILVDIHSNPFFSREDVLRRLTELASACEGPVIVMGDFNTPSDSVHFETLRQSFQNAFEAGGQGHLATWPVPCPVLAIDHIWTNRHVRVHRARHEESLQSDHMAVIAELSFPE